MKQYDDHGIFTLDLQRKRVGNKLSKRLVELLAGHFDPERIVYDFGCGTGEYMYELAKKGFRVQGFEGTPDINSIGAISIDEQDLTKEMSEPGEKGNVMCIEVAEHIPPQFENIFLNNITKYVDRHLVLSWAIPGQGGNGHVNERTSADVEALMVARGFHLNLEKSLEFRKEAGKDLRWLTNTIYVFTMG